MHVNRAACRRKSGYFVSCQKDTLRLCTNLDVSLSSVLVLRCNNSRRVSQILALYCIQLLEPSYVPKLYVKKCTYEDDSMYVYAARIKRPQIRTLLTVSDTNSEWQ